VAPPSSSCAPGGSGDSEEDEEEEEEEGEAADEDTSTRAPPSAAAVLPWRCLDAQHCGACALCMPPPAAGVTARLRAPQAAAAAPGAGGGVPGARQPRRRSGEKLLRAALCRTPEWRHAATRTRAADALAAMPGAAGGSGVVAALRQRNRDALSVDAMLALCRLWRYRSDAWAPLPAPPPPPPAALHPLQQQQHALQHALQQQQQLALLPAPLGGRAARLEAITRFVTHALGREQYTFLYSTATPNLFAAGAWEPYAPIPVDIAGTRRACAVSAALSAQLTRDAARLRAVGAALTPDEADAPAWRLGARAPPLARRRCTCCCCSRARTAPTWRTCSRRASASRRATAGR
jgi:hypothetical protein